MLRVMSAGAAGGGCASCTAAACGDGTGATAWSGACAGAARTVTPASKLWPQLAPVHPGGQKQLKTVGSSTLGRQRPPFRQGAHGSACAQSTNTAAQAEKAACSLMRECGPCRAQ